MSTFKAVKIIAFTAVNVDPYSCKKFVKHRPEIKKNCLRLSLLLSVDSEEARVVEVCADGAGEVVLEQNRSY